MVGAMSNYQPKPKAWFRDRIGKRIYRDDNGCCESCRAIAVHGLIVDDKQHADYLADIDAEFACEGVYLNYRDKL